MQIGALEVAQHAREDFLVARRGKHVPHRFRRGSMPLHSVLSQLLQVLDAERRAPRIGSSMIAPCRATMHLTRKCPGNDTPRSASPARRPISI